MMHSRYVVSRSFGQCVQRWLPGAAVIILSLACQSAGLAAPNPMVAMVDDRQNADRLLIVDCLLPGQVRQLGTGVTYMAPQRAIKTTAPDYASAALWYQKAADQGYARALINLGFLYEQGLGVTKDQANALKLYRKAAGIEGSINLDGAPAT